MEDMKQVKKLAVDYLHPELPIVTTDAFATGRNYFSRPSAEEYEDEDGMEERDAIMEDMKQLKKLAVDYLHPELPVITADPFATGRNYFSRPSAEEYEDVMEERDAIMEDMKQLKKLAVDYLHPEKPVETTDAFATGRNYFTRASAPDQESWEEAEERAEIIADAQALKKLAVDYLHPELPVVTTDPFASGRNYFSRPSAEEYEDEDGMEERDAIMEDMKQLKKLAIDYLHPELPVVTTDAFATGRNYFARPSAAGHIDHIHSHGAINHPYVDHHHMGHHYDGHFDDSYHYHDQHDDVSYSHHEGDHFDMDDDMFSQSRASAVCVSDFRASLDVCLKGEHPTDIIEEEDEGKLSRSPSSIMLFDLMEAM
jgi:hypothetical protein